MIKSCVPSIKSAALNGAIVGAVISTLCITTIITIKEDKSRVLAPSIMNMVTMLITGGLCGAVGKLSPDAAEKVDRPQPLPTIALPISPGRKLLDDISEPLEEK